MDRLQERQTEQDWINTCPHVDPLDERSIAGSINLPHLGVRYLCCMCCLHHTEQGDEPDPAAGYF